MNSLLNIKEALEEDESMNYQCYQFYPETGTQLNNPGNITITVNNSDNFSVSENLDSTSPVF